MARGSDDPVRRALFLILALVCLSQTVRAEAEADGARCNDFEEGVRLADTGMSFA